MATGTWLSKSTNYAKGKNAWSGNLADTYVGNSFCVRVLLDNMSAVSVASVLTIQINRKSGNGSFPLWFYAGNDSNVLAEKITTSCTLLGTGTLTTGTGEKTFSILGKESVLNSFSGQFYLYIVSDGTYTANTVTLTGSTGASSPHIDATYESSAVRVNIGGSWKTGVPYVNVGGSWKPGVIYTNIGGSWKVGI